jgi:hypothetical protein
MAEVHPALRSALEAGDTGRLSVIVRLRPTQQGAPVPPAEDTVRIAQSLLARASNATNQQPDKVSVLKHIGTVVVAAAPEYLRALVDDEAVAEAFTNDAGTVLAPAPVRVAEPAPDEERPARGRG